MLNLKKIKPLYDRIIIRRINNEIKTPSGIFLPETAIEKLDQGEVIAKGDGKIMSNGTIKPLIIKVNDKVLFGKYSGQTIKINNEELLVMREEDIFAIIN